MPLAPRPPQARSQANLAEVTKAVDKYPWLNFLAKDEATRSSTSVGRGHPGRAARQLPGQMWGADPLGNYPLENHPWETLARHPGRAPCQLPG